MFSINIYLRFALIVATLGLGLWLHLAFGFWYGFVFYLAFLFFVVGYFLLGTVQSAAMLLQTGQFAEAEQRLSMTFFPKLLYSANKAYFYMLKGTIALNDKRNDEAEMWLEKAQTVGLNTDNEKAMVLLQLCNLNATRNKWQQAAIQMKQLKDLKVTEPAIKDQIKQLDKAMANRSLIKPGNRGMIQQGGKRRRPPAR